MKFSIITVCRNSEETIERTIQSVICQTYIDFEYIIVDGKSEDKTLEIIEKYKDKITKIISEPDNGIYDAMNKGLSLATGDYVMFLNSDDVFLHEKVLSLVAEKSYDNKYDILYGDLLFLKKNNGHCNNSKQGHVNYIYLCGGMLYHPTIFAKKTLFDKIGNFDTNYKIIADYDWILRALVQYKATCKHLEFTTTVFSDGEGVSTNIKNREQARRERLDSQKKYFNIFKIKAYTFLHKNLKSCLKLPLVNQFLNYQFIKDRQV